VEPRKEAGLEQLVVALALAVDQGKAEKKVIWHDVSKNLLVSEILTVPLTRQGSIEKVEERVARARDGDPVAREDLVRDYVPFILKTAASVVKRYLVAGQDDEASVALAAFNEAIDAYVSPRPGFLAFAATVIRRRLVDYYRRERRHSEIPFSSLGNNSDEAQDAPVENLIAQDYDADEWQRVIERRDEIERWKEVLREFGLTLGQVVKWIPKHADARERAKRVAQAVARVDSLREHFLQSKELPIDELLERLPEEDKVSRKTIERQKPYITAMVIVLACDFPTLREYLAGSEG